MITGGNQQPYYINLMCSVHHACTINLWTLMTITFKPNIYTDLISRYAVTTGRTSQTKPYAVATAYSRRVNDLLVAWGSYSTYRASFEFNIEAQAVASRARGYAYNKAYDRFVAKLGDSSSFGATLTAERQQTFSMISDLVTRALLATRAAKRRDVISMLGHLGFRPPLKRVTRIFRSKRRKKSVRVSEEYYRMPDGTMVLKSAGSAWLLWSYGISPLISDIHNATDVFIRAQPDHVVVKSGAKETFSETSENILQFDGTRKVVNGSVRVGITSHVKVANYDLWLANQLGLINPVQFINEAIPFSFVVDWFSNWSSVINSLSAFAGLTLTNSCTSTVYKCKRQWDYYVLSQKYPYIPNNQKSRTLTGVLSIDGSFFVRTLGISAPALVFRYERFEWRRALNAMSLLVGFLPDKPITRRL